MKLTEKQIDDKNMATNNQSTRFEPMRILIMYCHWMSCRPGRLHMVVEQTYIYHFTIPIHVYIINNTTLVQAKSCNTLTVGYES